MRQEQEADRGYLSQLDIHYCLFSQACQGGVEWRQGIPEIQLESVDFIGAPSGDRTREYWFCRPAR